ncbi:MaoC family dehydratase [Maritimibacter fusiformis]|uniref:MaoC family dehydratase n=1 Tax=Maritimibacter fusiformis TaxID=2603819 RepID=A0A5D0RN76_9RHOB|nr:MaoC family dehydratase [Maritimibacter fusiformis]TYB82295.1 MaoC family dehydratase [Maritimibacter fusiformis]
MTTQRYFEDLPVGFRFSTGAAVVDRDAIVAFARDWDPQSFHLDDDAAAASHFGGLIASGWQTLLIAFNLSLRAGVWDEASMGASGLDEVRWLRPVFPGDRLHVEAEVLAAERSASRPDRGRVRIRHEVVNQSGEVVASYIGNHLIAARA